MIRLLSRVCISLAFVLAACAPDEPVEVSSSGASVSRLATDATPDPGYRKPAGGSQETLAAAADARAVWWTAIATATTTTSPQRPRSSSPSPTSSSARSGECGGWEGLIASLWPASQVPKACHVMGCETGWTFNPASQNRSSSAAGLFQLLSLHAWRFEARGWSWADRYDGPKNATVAHDLWLESGWGPWVCA